MKTSRKPMANELRHRLEESRGFTGQLACYRHIPFRQPFRQYALVVTDFSRRKSSKFRQPIETLAVGVRGLAIEEMSATGNSLILKKIAYGFQTVKYAYKMHCMRRAPIMPSHVQWHEVFFKQVEGVQKLVERSAVKLLKEPPLASAFCFHHLVVPPSLFPIARAHLADGDCCGADGKKRANQRLEVINQPADTIPIAVGTAQRVVSRFECYENSSSHCAEKSGRNPDNVSRCVPRLAHSSLASDQVNNGSRIDGVWLRGKAR